MKQYIGTKIVQAEPAFRVSTDEFKNVIHPKTYAIPDDRTAEYYKNRPCLKIVEDAAEIVAQMIAENSSK